MKTILTFLIIPVFALIACGNSFLPDEKINIVEEANKIAVVLKTKSERKIAKICTEKGLKSLEEWTHSFKNDQLMTVITDKLASKRFVYTVSESSVYTIDISEEEMNDGDNVGRIILIVQNGKVLIDGYEGGFSVNMD